MGEYGFDESWSVDSSDRLRDDRIGYDPGTEYYYAQYDEENVEDLTITVVRSVAAITGKAPEEFDPLYTVVDPDALKQVLDRPMSNPSKYEGVSVTFHFERCEIRVSSDGMIRIRPPDNTSTHTERISNFE